MTKEQLAKLGITIEEDSVDEAKAIELIEKKHNELSSANSKLKKRTDELTSEIAEKKRLELEKLSEEEKTKLHYEEMEKEIASLKRKDSLNTKVNDLMSIGYDKELATKYANAELDGKSTIEYQKAFMNSKLEAQKQELLKGTTPPKVDSGDEKGKFTKENFKKGLISMSEMNELKESNPTLYKEIISE